MLGMQLKIMYFMVYTPFSFTILQDLVVGNVIEHDRIFIFVYANLLLMLNFGMWVDAGSGGIRTKGVENKNLFMRGGRAVKQ